MGRPEKAPLAPPNGGPRVAYMVIELGRNSQGRGCFCVGICTEGKRGYQAVPKHTAKYSEVAVQGTVNRLNARIGISREVAAEIVTAALSA